MMSVVPHAGQEVGDAMLFEYASPSSDLLAGGLHSSHRRTSTHLITALNAQLYGWHTWTGTRTNYY